MAADGRAAVAVRNRRIEAVSDVARADFPQPRPMAEHFVAHDHEEMVLRQIEAEPLPEAVADAERARQQRRFVEAHRRQPAILQGGDGTVNREEIERASRGRHVAIEHHDVRRRVLRGGGGDTPHVQGDEKEGDVQAPLHHDRRAATRLCRPAALA